MSHHRTSIIRPLFASKLALVAGLALGILSTGCGDAMGPILQSIDIKENGTVTQSLDIDRGGSNFFAEGVAPGAVLQLNYDEPVDQQSAEDKISLRDEDGSDVNLDVDVGLVDIEVLPAQPMLAGNHVITIKKGVQDAAGNPTVRDYNITFEVE